MISSVNDRQSAAFLLRSTQTSTSTDGGFSDALLSYGGGSSFSLEDENSVSYDTSIEEEEQRTEAKSLLEEFSKWAHMDVAELIRAQYLEDHGMTEESLAAMDPDARKEIETEIANLIEERLGVNKSVTADATTATTGTAVESAKTQEAGVEV